MLRSAGPGWVGHDRLYGLEVHWAGQGRAGEDLVGPGRSRIGLPTEPREPRQAQASAKDRSAPGVCGILRYKMPVPPLPSPAQLCPFLPQSATAYPYPICPILAQPYPDRLCTVQYCSSRRPCPVLLTTTDPVRSCPALLNTDRPFVVLPGPSRPCLVLSGAALFHSAWRCPARYLLLSHGRLCTNLPGPALLCQFCHVPPSLALPQGRTQGGRGPPPWDLKNSISSGFLPLNYAICIC